MRALAVTSATRFFSLPDIPTTSEAGVPGYMFTSWQGMVAPAGLPAAIVNRLNSEIAALLAEPATIERIKTFGNNPSPSSPAEFKARIAADIDKWTHGGGRREDRADLTRIARMERSSDRAIRAARATQSRGIPRLHASGCRR